MVPQLEEMGPDVGEWTRVLPDNVQVLISQLPHSRAPALKEGRVVQVPLCTHDPLHACVLDASLHILQAPDVPIGKHRDSHRLPNCLDVLPRGCSCHGPLLLLGAPMHSQELTASLLQHLGVSHCLVNLWEDTNFARDRNRESLMSQQN